MFVTTIEREFYFLMKANNFIAKILHIKDLRNCSIKLIKRHAYNMLINSNFPQTIINCLIHAHIFLQNRNTPADI